MIAVIIIAFCMYVEESQTVKITILEKTAKNQQTIVSQQQKIMSHLAISFLAMNEKRPKISVDSERNRHLEFYKECDPLLPTITSDV